MGLDIGMGMGMDVGSTDEAEVEVEAAATWQIATLQRHRDPFQVEHLLQSYKQCPKRIWSYYLFELLSTPALERLVAFPIV